MKLASCNEWHISLVDFARWTFQPTDNYGADCAFGRRLATEYLNLNSDPSFAPSLGWAVQSIGKLDRPLSGVEIGFFHGLNDRLAALPVGCLRPELTVIDGGRLVRESDT